MYFSTRRRGLSKKYFFESSTRAYIALTDFFLIRKARRETAFLRYLYNTDKENERASYLDTSVCFSQQKRAKLELTNK